MKPRHEFASSEDFKAAVRVECRALLEKVGAARSSEIGAALGIPAIQATRVMFACKEFMVAGYAPRPRHPQPERVWRLRAMRGGAA